MRYRNGPASFSALFALVIIISACTPARDRTSDTTDKAAQVERRLSALRRGVNLSQWFAQTPSSPVRLQTAIVLDDVQRIRRMGFDHVRLPVDPEVLTAGGPADAPDANQLY